MSGRVVAAAGDGLPETIGKYRITRVLGAGATSTVYHGTDPFQGREVAVKVINADLLTRGEDAPLFLEQFLKEASLAGRLTHPHIVAILDAAISDDYGYVAMEYLEGKNLAAYTRPASLLPVGEAMELIFKCCGALDFAFRMGVVHRDLKPANIMVRERDGEREAKVADFGAAYFHNRDAAQKVIMGTPYYMSPEQVRSERLTHHSDMFSLGVVAYELLTGQRPFLGQSLELLAQHILEGEPEPPSALRAGVPPALDAVVMRALAKAPAGRHPTWADLALDLARIGQLSSYERAVPDSEKFRSLRAMRVFEALDDAMVWELVRAARWARLPARTTITREGEIGRSVFFLAAGEIKVTRSGRLLNILKRGECFGEMSYVNGPEAPRSATVEALTDALVAEFDNATLDRATAGCQALFAKGLLRMVAERLAFSNNRIAGTVS